MIPSPHFTSIIASPLGPIGFVIKNDKLVSLDILNRDHPLKLPQHVISQHVANELNAYFANPKHVFQIELVMQGTPFQQKVWQAIQAIPSGRNATYGALAKQLKSGPRAIGQACRRNAIGIIIPCHRVVAANHLGGYAGTTEGKPMDTKTWLLKHEGLVL